MDVTSPWSFQRGRYVCNQLKSLPIYGRLTNYLVPVPITKVLAFKSHLLAVLLSLSLYTAVHQNNASCLAETQIKCHVLALKELVQGAEEQYTGFLYI